MTSQLSMYLKSMVYNSFSFSLIICEAESSSSYEEHRRRRCAGGNVIEILQCKSNLVEEEGASHV